MDEKPTFALAAAITTILTGAAVLNHALEEQTPACILAAKSPVSVCPAKAAAALHVHGDHLLPVDSDPFPLPLQSASANFFASEYVPRRRYYAQVEQQGANICLFPPTAKPVCSGTEPPHDHVHGDRHVDVVITPQPAELSLATHAAAVSSLTATLTVQVESLCGEPAPVQHHLERKEGDPALGNNQPPPNPNANMMRQVMASYPDPAAYWTPPPVVVRSAAALANASDPCPEKQAAQSHTHHEPQDDETAGEGFILKEDGGYLLAEDGNRIPLENG